MSIIHDQYNTIENIRFKHDCIGKLIRSRSHQNNGALDNNGENIIRQNTNLVHEVHIRNCQECNIDNNVANSLNHDFNQKIFYILKFRACNDDYHKEDYASLGYKPSEYFFQEYIKGITKSINDIYENNKNIDENVEDTEIKLMALQQQVKKKQDEVLSVLKEIIELVSFLHGNKIVLKNIQLNNIMICKNDKILNAKIVNLSDAEAIATDTSKVYEEDLKNIGKLFLSFATNGENVEKVLKDINRHSEYKLKLKPIEKVIRNINWIEPYRKKLFAHLIIYLIEIDDCDESTILDFENHPFFWDYNNIEEFIRIVSCRVDYNDKLKDKAIMKKRIRAINFEMESYDDWKKFIDVSIHKYIQTETYKKCELKCNELIKFIRNKIAHQDDDTDNEDFIPDPSEPSSSSPNRSDSPPSKKKKTAKDQKSLFDFFDKRGGPLNYFLYKFPDLLHDLYRYFQKYSNHKKVKQFYPNCFQYELPRIARKSFKSCSHAPVDTKSKNEALIYNERKSRQMEFSPKRKIL